MKITSIAMTLFEPSWNDDPFTPRGRSFVALEIHTDDGLTGISRTWGPQIPYIRDYLRPTLDQDFRIDDGLIQLTSKPGLGLAFDAEYLARYRTAVV